MYRQVRSATCTQVIIYAGLGMRGDNKDLFVLGKCQ